MVCGVMELSENDELVQQGFLKRREAELLHYNFANHMLYVDCKFLILV